MMILDADRPPPAIAPPVVGPTHVMLSRRPPAMLPPGDGPTHGEYLAESYSDPATGEEWQVVLEWWRVGSVEAAQWPGRLDPHFPDFKVCQKIVFFEDERPCRVVRPWSGG